MGIRRKGRELAVQVLYQIEMTKEVAPAILEATLKRIEGSAKAKEFARRLVLGVVEHQEEIDQLLERFSENWRLNRMAKVDLTILRMAAYELLFCADIPINVSIDEALEVGKRYGSEESSPFINGILDQVALARRARVCRG
jgi:N utilization substance protein B